MWKKSDLCLTTRVSCFFMDVERKGKDRGIDLWCAWLVNLASCRQQLATLCCVRERRESKPCAILWPDFVLWNKKLERFSRAEFFAIVGLREGQVRSKKSEDMPESSIFRPSLGRLHSLRKVKGYVLLQPAEEGGDIEQTCSAHLSPNWAIIIAEGSTPPAPALGKWSGEIRFSFSSLLYELHVSFSGVAGKKRRHSRVRCRRAPIHSFSFCCSMVYLLL